MKFRSEAIRGGIKYLGGIQELEFITAAGLKANRKLELDVLAKQTKTSRFIRQLVISEIVSLVEPYQPDAVVSIPTGADHLTVGICQRMNIPGIRLDWLDKTPGQKHLEPRSIDDAELLARAGRIALIDDVFSTGSSLLAAHDMVGVGNKVEVACVVWNRSDAYEASTLPFALEATVSEYIPLRNI